jgi:hypothetical protein
MNPPQRQLNALVPLLLVLAMSELALNRLAVPALRMPASGRVGLTPPLWHQLLDYVALFLQYFASTLALATVALLIVATLRDRETWPAPLRYPLAALGSVFGLLAAATIATPPGENLTFWFETAFTATLAVLVLAQLRPGGSVGAKIGVALLSIPLAFHYYGALASRTPGGREALWLGVPDQLQALGQWGVVAVALISPYLFTPRPAARALAQLVPLLLALALTLASGLLLYHSYEVGMIVASRGLGLDLGPGAPTSHLGLYVLGLGSIAWTTLACLVASAPARRRLGIGLGLVIAGGYALTWPLHYLVSAIGIWIVADAGRRVVREERALREASLSAAAAHDRDEVT